MDEKKETASLSITFTDSDIEEKYDNRPIEELRGKLEEIRKRGYDLIPMFVFGGGTDTVFLWAYKKGE